MRERKLRDLVYQFWNAIIYARDTDQFHWDERFDNFPNACCRDASDLLAKFLYDNDYSTLSVYGSCQGSSHRWLVWDDGQIGNPESWYLKDSIPSDILKCLNSYGADTSAQEEAYYNYTEHDIENCIIIDITADQFKDPPIYCDRWSRIRKKYEFIKAEKYDELKTGRLQRLYATIIDVIRN